MSAEFPSPDLPSPDHSASALRELTHTSSGEVALAPTLGGFVGEHLGLSWRVETILPGLGLDDMVGLALRENPLRAQLVVSRLLGKHLPADPTRVIAAAAALASLLAAELEGDPARALSWPAALELARSAGHVGHLPGSPVVMGYCETATALGHVLAESFTSAFYVHTTRRPDPAVAVLSGFQEEHSHAASHLIQLAEPERLTASSSALVLVDDELTTGNTALNTIAALHALAPRSRYLIATLMDLRSPLARAEFDERVAQLGLDVSVVALMSGELVVPPTTLAAAALLREQLTPAPASMLPASPIELVSAIWPATLALGGRTGLVAATPEHEAALVALASQLRAHLADGATLVVGCEELMWLPLRLAALLGPNTLFQSSTRSPVAAHVAPGYAIARALLFPSPDEPDRLSRIHNVVPLPAPAEEFLYEHIVILTDTSAPAARPMAQMLAPFATRSTLVVSL